MHQTLNGAGQWLGWGVVQEFPRFQSTCPEHGVGRLNAGYAGPLHEKGGRGVAHPVAAAKQTRPGSLDAQVAVGGTETEKGVGRIVAAQFVMDLVEYKWDWQNYGSPDYVATARQALARRSGDCEDRAIVLASVFAAKNLPYSLRASPVHYWIDYPGRKSNKGENEKVAFFGKTDGKFRIKMPDMGQWRRYFVIGKKGFWDTMPGYRKIIMIAGWLTVIFLVYLLNRRRKAVVGDEQSSSQYRES